ncbi:glycoside hydrolase family 32 protein [Paenibacillus caui]|uniref:glycoside hydrolase family 32 protein n=1 Tax=Paenibacillus caui TaxID=2873927 RepID=UPI001CA8E867|nr:glycoside hydrolase family 32 protein [Paenibacillus caui]
MTEQFNETLRPQFHFTPAANWMNDPNGLVYYEGEYHLFYQHHPDSCVWGPMHWGHAVSRDLVHWEHLPIALFPDEAGMIFSGCCVVDQDDSSGLFNGGSGLVALFTLADDGSESGTPFQCQGIAFSKDRGRTWTKYAGNPVLSDENYQDFRDPKVFWHEDSGLWVMLLAAGDRIAFYTSPNLREWSFASHFGIGEGSHDGVWECPDLFRLSAGGGRSKWIMIVSIGDSPEAGSKTQYFIGEFDGREFRNDRPADEVLWLDDGRDNYAGVSWSDIPDSDGRRIYIGWMNNWKYAKIIPAESWRGAMTLPRELYLKQEKDGLRLVQTPVRELRKLRLSTESRDRFDLKPGADFRLSHNRQLLEIEVLFELGQAAEVGLKLSTGIQGQETKVGYDARSQELFIDRTVSGETKFHPDFACRHSARMNPADGTVQLQIWVDRSSVEVFGDGGKTVMTDQIFPGQPGGDMEFYALGGSAAVLDLHVHELESIYR